MSSPFKVIAVEVYDSSLEGAAGALQDALDKTHAETPLKAIQVFPFSSFYSLPADDGSLRDYHYNEKGFIIVGTKK